MTKGEQDPGTELRDSLIAILGGPEVLSDMLRRFIDTHRSEPDAAELMPAIAKAKRATECAAALVRARVRTSD